MPKSLKNLHVFKLIWFIPVYKSFNFGYIYPVILDLHYHKWDKDLAAFFPPPCLNKNYSISLLLGTGHSLTWLNWLCLDWGKSVFPCLGTWGILSSLSTEATLLSNRLKFGIIRWCWGSFLWENSGKLNVSVGDQGSCHYSSRDVLMMALGSNLSGRTSWLCKSPFCKCPGFKSRTHCLWPTSEWEGGTEI